MDEKGVSWLKGSCIAESRLDVQTAFCYTSIIYVYPSGVVKMMLDHIPVEESIH